MDPNGDGGRGGLTPTGLACGSCGTELPPNSKFCNKCGAPVTQVSRSAEYKQVTVLFADVVHSMDIAAAVGAERLREIIADVADRCAAVVQRYGGTVDKFTGDGIMAVFGAPVALEDHAVRACLAALGAQEEAKRLAVDVRDRDGVDLRLRVGLNSGQVIAGEIGSGPFGYTAMGEQVGMAQRMESVAPPGGVMLSVSTARLVEHATLLAEAEKVHIKGTDAPVLAHRLLGVAPRHDRTSQAALVGRELEVTMITGLLDRSISGRGCVVCVAGPAGIGKTRLVGETVLLAKSRNAQVFSTFCESHATDIAFHVVARLLRSAAGVMGLNEEAARARVREQLPQTDEQDLLLLDDLLGIADPDAPLARIDPDARRRRLTALVNAVSLARTRPALYVVEDAHWIDEVSESMLADFFTVVPQTRSMVLITYRSEYEGVLARTHGALTIAFAPLSDLESTALVAELLGPDSSVGEIGEVIVARAVGNPFFVQEMVRDLAERGVLQGQDGCYVCHTDVAEISVPGTLQATIAARIDRLGTGAKKTINAAAVIGFRFTASLLRGLGVDPVLDELVQVELVDQVRFTPSAEFAFRHPLIRTVAYESQLRSDRAQLHRRLATAIEVHDPDSADESAALIAEHLEEAGDPREAYVWHMRAARWSGSRDLAATRVSLERARQVADALPANDPDRTARRIAPRARLCASAWRLGGGIADAGFDELRELCTDAADKTSLAIGMAGQLATLTAHAEYRESSRLASECAQLLESIGDPRITVGVLPGVCLAKFEAGDMGDAMRFSQRIIDLAEDNPTRGKGISASPLAVATLLRGLAKCCLGRPGWKNDCDEAIAMASATDSTSRIYVNPYIYLIAIPNAALLADEAAMHETAETLTIAERSTDDFGLATARAARGIVLAHRDGEDHRAGFDLLATAREAALQQRYSMTTVPMIDIQAAKDKLRSGDLDAAVAMSRTAFEDMCGTGGMLFRGPAITVLVESLLARGTVADHQEAQVAIERLAGVPTDLGFVLHDLPLLRLRALLAQARGDEAAYRDYRDRYRALATSLGFEGHMKWAEAMP